jgi:Endomembrane protein 70
VTNYLVSQCVFSSFSITSEHLSSFVCYMQERDIGDEYGWKQVHGDVFRPAAFPIVFASLIGTGVQIAFVTFSTVGLAMVGELYTE